MATKKQESVNLIDIFKEFNDLKNIDKQTFINVMEDSFRNVIAKMYGSDANFDVIINPTKGDLEIYRNRTVVADDVEANPNTEIHFSEARLIDDECEIGEDVTDKVDFMKFGRRTILNLRQTLASKILDLQKENFYIKYDGLRGQIVSGELYQVWKREMLILDEDGNDMYLPKANQIPSDFYRKGDTIRAVVEEVENKNQNPRVILSRTSPIFLRRLFEQEIPEIHDGLISIKDIARIPGERAKVAVESFDDRIDPVGACVGIKGTRIHGIVRELRNENIDVINYTNNINLYIQRALAPAKISSIEIDETNKTANVYLDQDQVSLAIGKGGVNIKLAIKLTGYQIEVFREIKGDDSEDIKLSEFTDEFEQWIIDEFYKAGFNTAKQVLAVAPEELYERIDLEEETINDVINAIKAEFARDDEDGNE